MGSKNKLKRFKENESFSNFFQPERSTLLENNFELKGNWSKDYFKNPNPIVLELGCGKGEYTVALAQKNPNINYIGIDIKGARMWRGAKTAEHDQLKNVAFLRIQIELIAYAFAANEVNSFWITFPDPQIKFQRTKHRLTNPEFLSLYQKVGVPNADVHLKTDSAFLHGYTLGVVQAFGWPIVFSNHDIYKHNNAPAEVLETKTFYEMQYLERQIPITYLNFRLP